jgi:hypothetical protein
MRAATHIAATMIAIGLYVAIAAVASLPPTWIGLGILGIASVAAVSLVAGGAVPRAAGVAD